MTMTQHRASATTTETHEPLERLLPHNHEAELSR
jgi:hypothetical protein